jgi:hypothetical protein
MERAFERAFSRVHTTVAAAIPDPEGKKAAKLLSEEERLRQETAPINAADAVARISLAHRDGDYFRCSLLSARPFAARALFASRCGPRRAHVTLALEPKRSSSTWRWPPLRPSPRPAPRNHHPGRLLQLPRPEADELGRPVWGCTASDISKSYRKLSVLVHPDKVGADC